MTLVPSKTKLLVIYPHGQTEAVEYVKVINNVKIAGQQVPFTDETDHVGILRSRSGNLPPIMKRITAHKKALAAICSVGIAKGYRGSPSSALKLQQLYGTSVLISGVASLVLNSKEISVLENHYKQTIERIQKLHCNNPWTMVYFLAGTLPIEGIIHYCQLSMFFMICRLKSDLLHNHAKSSMYLQSWISHVNHGFLGFLNYAESKSYLTHYHSCNLILGRKNLRVLWKEI